VLPRRIGIAIGPRTWFGNQYGSNVSFSGTVENNLLSGAFGYGIAVTSARNFTVQGNTLFGNTSFIGSKGPNCTENPMPSPDPFVVDNSAVQSTTLQSDFQSISNGDGLTCIIPPNGDYWPYGGNTDTNSTNSPVPVPEPATTTSTGSKGLSGGAVAGVVVGVICGISALAVVTWYIRKWALKRAADKSFNRAGYMREMDTI
jgi:parallel beta-helix repeat protein